MALGSRGCLLEAPHLILGSIKQSVSVLFEIRDNIIYDPLVVPTTCGECGVVWGGVVWGVVSLVCVVWSVVIIRRACGLNAEQRVECTQVTK